MKVMKYIDALNESQKCDKSFPAGVGESKRDDTYEENQPSIILCLLKLQLRGFGECNDECPKEKNK